MASKGITPGKQEGELSRTGRTWDPLEAMREMFKWDAFRELGFAAHTALSGFNPSFDLKETGDALIFKADLPGLRDEEVDVSVSGSRLTISGRREEEKRSEGDHVHLYERTHGAFTRSFTLPEGADADAVSGELKDGVLTVRVPKKSDVQPRKVSLRREGKEAKA